MIIELKGVNFVNKGAELMFYSILDKLREDKIQEKFDIKVAVDQSRGPYIKRAKLGLYQKIWLQRYGIQWGRIGEVLPNKLKEKYGLVTDSDIDIVLDASGFGYSDQWGPATSEQMAKWSKKWKNRGTKVILMPQAFGPFENNRVREAFLEVVKNVDLVYARDVVSYDHIINIAKEHSNKIKISPDFTNLTKGTLPTGFNAQEYNQKACIIPNYRMIDKTSKTESDAYISFLITSIKHLLSKKIVPFILIHELDKDLDLAKMITSQLDNDIEIIRESDPLHIKGIIGSSFLVIGSRYHGLISALSQSVPSIATGWSHKYNTLFEEYECKELILRTDSQYEEIMSKINYIIDADTRLEVISNLNKNSELLKTKASEMWDEIFNLLDK